MALVVTPLALARALRQLGRIVIAQEAEIRNPMKNPAAFISYAHRDDAAYGSRITGLRQRLQRMAAAATGRDLDIFQDCEGIAWGQHWSRRLDEALEEALFLIPILTPSYFSSLACRAELETFLELEHRSGQTDRILSLYFITAPVYEQKRGALAAILSDRQHRDWRHLRIDPLGSPKVLRALDGLARELAGAIHVRQEHVSSPATSPAAKTTSVPAKDTHWRDQGYQDTSFAGRVTFNYTNNDGLYSIGSDEFLFETKWSKASDRSIHLCSDPASISGIAEAPQMRSHDEIGDPLAYDMSSRVRTIQEGEHAIIKNKYNRYAVLKIIDVKDRTRSDSIDELTFDFWILTNDT